MEFMNNVYYITWGNYVAGMDHQLLRAESEDQAVEEAYWLSIECYDSWAGMHGLTGYEEIMEDDPDLSEEDVEEEYNQVREDCVEYSAELFDPNNEDHIEELNTPRYGGNLDNV